MASLGDVSRYLRQRRAIGKPVTRQDRAAAWEAYFDSLHGKTMQRKAIQLDRDRMAIQQDQFQQNKEIQQSQFDQSMDLQRQQREDAEDAAKISGAVQLGTLGLAAANTDIGGKAIDAAVGFGKKLFGAQGSTTSALGADAALGGTALSASGGAPAISSAFAGGAPAIEPAGLAGGYAEVALNAPGAAPAATSALPTLSQIALPAAAGGIVGGWAGKQTLKSETAQNFIEDATFGVIHAKKDAAKITGAGAGALAGAAVGAKIGAIGGPVGAVIGGVVGLVTSGGSWICTRTKDLVGFKDEEWEMISKFRKYAVKNHSDWLEAYLKVGPELLVAMDGDKKFYADLKETFLMPIINLSMGGFYEAAYKTYKSVVIQLVEKYKPSLMEEAPEA